MPISSISNFLIRQNNALLRGFSGAELSLVAVSPNQLASMQACHGWRVEGLPKIRLSSAFVVHKRRSTDPECWARWNYAKYRNAFAIFLKQHHSEFGCQLTRDVQVDHLEPKYRFSSHDQHYVRLHLVEKKINAAYGAFYEKNFFQRERETEAPSGVHMSYIAFSKASGFVLPRKSDGVLVWEEWARQRARVFSDNTKTPELIELHYHGFLGVLRLGYTGYYSGEASSSTVIDFR